MILAAQAVNFIFTLNVVFVSTKGNIWPFSYSTRFANAACGSVNSEFNAAGGTEPKQCPERC